MTIATWYGHVFNEGLFSSNFLGCSNDFIVIPIVMPIMALFFQYFIQFIIALAKMYFPACQQASLAKA